MFESQADKQEMLTQQDQSEQRAEQRAHLTELVAEGVVMFLELLDSILRMIGYLGSIPILGLVIKAMVWVARAIVSALKIIPERLVKGEKKEELRRRLIRLRLRKEVGLQAPLTPSPHGTAEDAAPGMLQDGLLKPLFNFLRLRTDSSKLFGFIGPMNPNLLGILKVFGATVGAMALIFSAGSLLPLIL